jgi:hypothetical protein
MGVKPSNLKTQEVEDCMSLVQIGKKYGGFPHIPQDSYVVLWNMRGYHIHIFTIQYYYYTITIHKITKHPYTYS